MGLLGIIPGCLFHPKWYVGMGWTIGISDISNGTTWDDPKLSYPKWYVGMLVFELSQMGLLGIIPSCNSYSTVGLVTSHWTFVGNIGHVWIINLCNHPVNTRHVGSLICPL